MGLNHQYRFLNTSEERNKPSCLEPKDLFLTHVGAHVDSVMWI